MEIWGITDIGLVRSENQDCYHCELLEGGTALAVVCDGMGGARGGSVASATAVSAFVHLMKDRLGQENAPELPELLLRAVQEANHVVHSLSMEHEEYRGMGTTLVAAAVTAEELFVVNVGDSRCYLADEAGICRVTRDHSLVEDLVERGEITAEEARVHPKKNLITRALGVGGAVKADLFERKNTGGCLLLCSDGLSNVLTDEELCAEVHSANDGCCQRLLDLALERGAPDNVTAVVVQL